MPIEFVGIEYQFFALLLLSWEALYQVLKLAVSRSSHPKFAETGQSYVVSFINCTQCTLVGGYYLLRFVSSGSPVLWAYLDEKDPGAGFANEMKHAAHYFLSWMTHDLIHMISFYPTLGGKDQLVHHSGFICLCALLMGYNIFPGVAPWLLFSEVSTIPLNIRWFLINTGRGDGTAIGVANGSFVGLFFISRVVLYWTGFAYLFRVSMPLVLAPPYLAPPLLVYTLVGAIGGGALLNAYWLVLVVKMAMRPKGKKPKPE